MKKILTILFAGLISILIFPFNVNAKSISTLDVKNNNNKLTVSGTTENGVLAVAVMVYLGEDLSHMETCSSIDSKFSCELSKTFDKGNYTVKVADYDGGNYISKNITIDNKLSDNPKTLDNILFYIGLGIISILGIIYCILFLHKNRKIN